MFRRFSTVVALVLVATVRLSAADLAVPYLALLTNGRLNEAGTFELSTRVSIDMLIKGGDAFDAWFAFTFRQAAVESYLTAAGTDLDLGDGQLADLAAAIADLDEATGLYLSTVAIEAKRMLGLPFDLAAFVGHMDRFGTGDDFPALFGDANFATRFRGYMYYPDGIGGDTSRRYDGLHEAYGTGFRFGMPMEKLVPYLYIYQDSWLGAGRWSVDARVLMGSGVIDFEAFAGASLPVSTMGVYRGGLLFHYDTGVIGNFYAQIGVPRYDPTQPFGMDMLYFMFEPRVSFGAGELTLSLFFHPKYYLQTETDEEGSMEMRMDLAFGEVTEKSMRGGVETELAYNPNLDTGVLTLEAAPYLNLVRNGVRWDLRLAVRAFPFPNPWYGMFMPQLGVSTAF